MRTLFERKRRPLQGASILWPTMVGMTCYFAFMSLVESNAFGNPMVYRYFAGHWVSKTTTAMGWVGLIALLAHGRLVLQQLRVRRNLEPPVDASAEEPVRAQQLLDQIAHWDRSAQAHYRTQRLKSGLQYVVRTGSADGLAEELKYLADMDTHRQSEHYSYVRILIWATPLFGFLGTVLGISQALGSISLGPGSEFQEMMNVLRDNLYVAFDTTALALILSIALMFIMYLVNRYESGLLTEVEEEAGELFSSWFALGNQSGDEQVRAMHRIGRAMVAATHEMSQKQIELWRRSIESAQAAWLQACRNTYELVDSQLGRTLHDSLSQMAEQLTGSLRHLDHALDERARQWQDRLVHVSERLVDLHQQTASDQQQSADLLAQQIAQHERVGELEWGSLLDSLNLLSTRLQQFVAQATAEGSAGAGETTRAVNSGLRVFDELRGDRAA